MASAGNFSSMVPLPRGQNVVSLHRCSRSEKDQNAGLHAQGLQPFFAKGCGSNGLTTGLAQGLEAFTKKAAPSKKNFGMSSCSAVRWNRARTAERALYGYGLQ